MDVNAIVQQGGFGPGASPVVSAPSSVNRGSGGQRAPAPPETAPVVNLSQEDRPQPAVDVVEARKAQSTPDGLHLRVDKATDRVVAEIVNESNEVIKQLPPEESLRAAARFRHVVGLLFDQQI